MAIIEIVSANGPVGPGQVAAGNITVSPGNTYVITSGANSNITFSSNSGPVSFDVIFASSNTNNFDVKFNSNTNPEITISNGVSLPKVKIDGDKSTSLTMNVGDNVLLDEFKGSDGVDDITIGNNFTTKHDFDTREGDDVVKIGNNANFNEKDIDLGSGNNSLTVGDGARLKDLETGDGNNTITFGDNLQIHDIETGEGNDVIVIGDNATIKDIKTDEGDDKIIVGDNFDIHKLDAEEGDDLVRLGVGGTIKKLDGGKGDDRLGSAQTYTNESFETIVCFVEGTLIETEYGPRPIETLTPGDPVVTKDHGLQPLRWIGRRRLSAQDLETSPSLRPIRIRAGALGLNVPSSDLSVSPQHRILVRSAISRRMFAADEILVAAKHLTEIEGVDVCEASDGVVYFHMLFDQHEVVVSNGAESESLYTGPQALKSIGREALQEITTLFPELTAVDHVPVPARLLAQGRRARQLAARHAMNEKPLLECAR